MVDYIGLISEFYPDTICYTTGEPDNYAAINWETTAIPQTELDVVNLTKYKTDKTLLFSEYARQDIEAGFYSSALGYPHYYDSKQEDQLNLVGSVASGADMPYACHPSFKPYQIIDCGGLATGTRSTGLPNTTATFNAEIKINGVSQYISIQGQLAQTYNDLVSEVNSDLALNSTATIVIEDGNLKVYGDNYGSTYTVEVIDASFGSNMTDFVQVLAPVAGIDGSDRLVKEYKTHTHTQLMDVINTGKDVKLTVLQKFQVKKDQISLAADEAGVDAIIWE